VNFIGTLGFSLVLPFLIFLVTRFGGNAQVYGILGATYPAFQLLGAAILGKWSDIYGRKIILLLSQAGTLFSWFIFLTALYVPVVTIQKINSDVFGIITLSVPLIILFIARALDGLTGGNISVAHAYLADITSEEERNKNFGRMAISANLGFIIGPALAGILGSTPLKETLPVMAAILISGIALLIIFFVLPESNRTEIEKDHVTVKQNHMSFQDTDQQSDKIDIKIRHIFKLKHIPYLFVLYFMIYLAFSIFYTAFPVHAAEILEWDIKRPGNIFCVPEFGHDYYPGPGTCQTIKNFF
jgi:MFS family permease